MKRMLILLVFIPSFVFSLTGPEIIRQVDKNQVFDSQKGKAVMSVNNNGKKMVKTMIITGVKKGNRFFVEFTNPEDKGVKYLRIGKELWIYLPDADDTMKISGHMLREGMMGSDISYEDMMDDEDLQSRYITTLIGETNLNGTDCYNVEMIAKKDDVTYYKRGTLVDKEKMVPLEYDLYAKSGRLLKKMTQSDIREYNGRWYANTLTIQDMKRVNSITTLEYTDLVFDAVIPERIFSLGNLKK